MPVGAARVRRSRVRADASLLASPILLERARKNAGIQVAYPSMAAVLGLSITCYLAVRTRLSLGRLWGCMLGGIVRSGRYRTMRDVAETLIDVATASVKLIGDQHVRPANKLHMDFLPALVRQQSNLEFRIISGRRRMGISAPLEGHFGSSIGEHTGRLHQIL